MIGVTPVTEVSKEAELVVEVQVSFEIYVEGVFGALTRASTGTTSMSFGFAER